MYECFASESKKLFLSSSHKINPLDQWGCCFSSEVSTSILDAHSKLSQTSKMELFAKIVNGWKSSTVFAKISILDVWPESENAPALDWIISMISLSWKTQGNYIQ